MHEWADVNEPLNNVNDWIYNLATFQEVRGVQRFSTQADLTAKRPTPVAGEFAWVTADKVLQVRDRDVPGRRPGVTR